MFQVVVDEAYHLMIGLALLAVDVEDNVEVAATVVPDFHPLLNAPWQTTGETIVSELLCRIRNSIH